MNLELKGYEESYIFLCMVIKFLVFETYSIITTITK